MEEDSGGQVGDQRGLQSRRHQLEIRTLSPVATGAVQAAERREQHRPEGDDPQQAVLDLRASGSTVIFSTHDMNTAEAMCDFVFMIFKGRKVLDGTLADVQDRYGTDTIRARIDGEATRLHGIPGVERVTDRGQIQELRLESGADSQEVLAAIMSRARVTHFELGRPSLHDIFVRIAGPEAEEAPNA